MSLRRYLDQRLRLQHFRAADAIATHQSLLKAAAALNMTQPAVTKALHEIEDIVQLRLFDRHSRGVRPTAAGLVFIGSARRILAELRRLDDNLREASNPEGGTVAAGVLPVAAAGVLPGVLTRLKSLKPDLRVRLEQGRTEDLLPLLAAGEIDLIIGRLYDPPVPDLFLREALWTEPISILARSRHPVLDGGPIDVETLRRFDLVLPTVTQRVGQEIEHLLARLGLTPATSYRSSSYGFIREMLHGSDALAIMPRLMMAGDLSRGTLRIVPLPVDAPDRHAGLILHGGRDLPPAGQAFAACLRAYVRELQEQGFADITIGNSSSRSRD